MSTRLMHTLWKLLAVLAVQLLLLNQLHLFGYATPVIMAYVTMNIERKTPRIPLLLWGCAAGFLFDLFSNTMGMGMASCTLSAMLQPALVEAFLPRNAAEDFKPSLSNMGTWRYLLYALTMMLLFHLVFYALDAFTLSHWTLTLTAIGAGTLVATALVVCLEALTHRRKH